MATRNSRFSTNSCRTREKPTFRKDAYSRNDSINGKSRKTPFGKYTSTISPEMSPSANHCRSVRPGRVRSQYQRNSATTNAECACDHAGLKYMYTGNELPNQIPTVARNAHFSSTYLRAREKQSSKPRNPYIAVPN